MRFVMRSACLVAGMMVILGTVAAHAQEALPSGKDVLEKYIAATGGREQYEKVTTRITHATMEMPEIGIKGKVTITQVAPDRGIVHSEIDNVGIVDQGTDGTIVWEKSAMMGPRMMEGQEREGLVRSLTINAELHPEKYYKSIECTGIEDVNGKPAYKVEIVTNSGGKETRYYDKESGLLVKATTRVQTQMGEMDVVSIAGQYKDVDGIKIPFESTQEMMNQKIVIKIEKVEHNVPVPEENLAVPADVKALLLKKSTTAPSTQPG